MGNLNCSSLERQADPNQLQYQYDHHLLRTSSPIKIQEVGGESIDPLITTIRRHKEQTSIIDKILGESKEKKKKTEKEMGEFIDGLLERGKQSNRYLDSLRKEKLVNEMKPKPLKKMQFNLNKFLMKQEQFLEKRNMSLEKSRQSLFASRTMEETYHPKINLKSRKIAIQVSSRNILNKKKVVLKGSGEDKWSKQNTIESKNYKSKPKQINKPSNNFSSKKLVSTKKTNDNYLKQKLKRQFESCCISLGLGQNLNYIQFTQILQQMSFANNDTKQRMMLLEGWNLLAGSRLSIGKQLIFSFILSLFGLEADNNKDLIEAEYRSVGENDSPQRVRQDLDCTFMSVDNQKRLQIHQDKLNPGIAQFIQDQYKPLRYNKIADDRYNLNSSVDRREKSESIDKEQQKYYSKRLKTNQTLASNHRSKIVQKAEYMNILQPRFGNKSMTGYQINKLSKDIMNKQIHQIQIQRQADELRQCSFYPDISPRKQNQQNYDHYFSYSKQKPCCISQKQKHLESTHAKKNKPEPILQIQVNIGTKIQKIIVFQGDDTNQIVDDFLQRNNLPLIFKQQLIANVSQGLAKIES